MSHQSYSELVQDREARAQEKRDEFESSLLATLDHEEMVALQRDLVMEVQSFLNRFYSEGSLRTLPHRIDIRSGSMRQPGIMRQVEAIALTGFARKGGTSLVYYIANRNDEFSLVRCFVSTSGEQSPYVVVMHRLTIDACLPLDRDISVEHLQVILDAMRQLLVDQQVPS